MSCTQYFFATCPRGLETPLVQELTQLGAVDCVPSEGGVAFCGSQSLMRAVNLHSRVASRVLWRLAERSVNGERDIYALARSVAWHHLFCVDHTIKVSTTAKKSSFSSTEFLSLKVKDAICDAFREVCGRRPNVDTKSPNMRIHLFLNGNLASLYLDTSGEALFKRGWRVHTREAPIRENLAAGLILLSGWQPDQPFFDPMCGSGTFLIEAANIALNRAPGRLRNFAFEQFLGMDLAAWTHEKSLAHAQEKEKNLLKIKGVDKDPSAIAAARANLKSADLDDVIELEVGEIPHCAVPSSAGILLTNPPYGVRLDELKRLEAFYPELGRWLKQACAGWTAFILTADPALMKGVRLSPSRKTPIFNGALECRLLRFVMVSGSNRREKSSASFVDGNLNTP